MLFIQFQSLLFLVTLPNGKAMGITHPLASNGLGCDTYSDVVEYQPSEDLP